MTIRRNARSLHFFMRLLEVQEIIWERAASLGLHILLCIRNGPLEIATESGTFRGRNGTAAWSVFLVRELPAHLPMYNDIPRGEWGCTELLTPREVGDVLTMSLLRAQGLNWDSNTSWARGEPPHENPDALVLYHQVASAFRKQIKYPVWSYSLRDSSPTLTARRDIAYSQGAAEWCLSGKRLRQDVGWYGGFSIDDTIHEDITGDSTIRTIE